MREYIEVDRARTPGTTCMKCGRKVEVGEKYLHMNRNKHVYRLCGSCLYIFAAQVIKDNPHVKVDAVETLLE